MEFFTYKDSEAAWNTLDLFLSGAALSTLASCVGTIGQPVRQVRPRRTIRTRDAREGHCVGSSWLTVRTMAAIALAVDRNPCIAQAMLIPEYIDRAVPIPVASASCDSLVLAGLVLGEQEDNKEAAANAAEGGAVGEKANIPDPSLAEPIPPLRSKHPVARVALDRPPIILGQFSWEESQDTGM